MRSGIDERPEAIELVGQFVDPTADLAKMGPLSLDQGLGTIDLSLESGDLSFEFAG